MTTTTVRHDGYVATFLDGPLAKHEQDRSFSVGEPFDDLWFAPLAVGKGGWALVGLGKLKPDIPWPGQVHYHLADVVENSGPTLAFYATASR